MSTKLESMVGYLAGRKVEPELLDELADPSSEASKFLEATRARSRALLAEPRPIEAPRTTRTGRGAMISLGLLGIAALVAFAATLQVVDKRFRLLEASLAIRDVEAKADARRLEALLERLAEPRPEPEWPRSLEASLKRIESGLGRVEAGSARPRADRPSELALEELAAIRREIAANELAANTRSEEVQAAVHDAARVLRLLLNRFDPPVLDPAKPPGFNPPRPPANGEPRRAKP
jgi:hypothetical protein